jgi:hypothetical protein
MYIRRAWLAHILALALLGSVGCMGDEGEALIDDDTDAGDDDDATAADDDDTVADDDDDTATDDDDSGVGDDDDTAGDDDDTADMPVQLLEIHLDNVTYAPVGYQFFGLADAPLDLADAADAVSTSFPGSLVDGCTAQGTYLDFHYCYRAPGDFGGAALVDGRSGAPVFAGESHWMGTGQLIFPSPLAPAADLQATGPLTIAPENAVYHLLGYEDDAVGDAALEAVRAMDLVRHWVAWCTYDAMVLLHPYEEGGYNPHAADLIVMLVLC